MTSKYDDVNFVTFLKEVTICYKKRRRDLNLDKNYLNLVKDKKMNLEIIDPSWRKINFNKFKKSR